MALEQGPPSRSFGGVHVVCSACASYYNFAGCEEMKVAVMVVVVTAMLLPSVTHFKALFSSKSSCKIFPTCFIGELEQRYGNKLTPSAKKKVGKAFL